MSIALDIALYLRDTETKDPLTLAERGVLFTLAFRVGSNSATWISQESLMLELDISERNLRDHLKKIADKGYILIKPDKKDKRKMTYTIASFLLNYHQKENRKWTKNYRRKTAGNSENTGRILPVNTGRKQPVISCTKQPTDVDKYGLSKSQNAPKAKEESNYKRKGTIYNATSVAQRQPSQQFLEFMSHYPNPEYEQSAWKEWRKQKLDSRLQEILEDIEERKRRDQKWIDGYVVNAEKYLANKQWEKPIPINPKTTRGKTSAFAEAFFPKQDKELFDEHGNIIDFG
jgi:hypothetical protein